MNTPQPSSDPQTNIELRLRTMRILWLAIVMSVGVYYLFTMLAWRSRGIQPNGMMSLVLFGIGLLTTAISFPIKSKLLTQATEKQQVPMVQQAYVVAFAITEVAALLGMIDFFLTSNPYYFIPFIVSGCGQLLHFPRREHVVNAMFKTPGF